MSGSPLWENLRPFKKRQGDETLELLKNIPVFSEIPEKGLRLIRAMCHTRHYKEDEHVFRSGEPGVGMYIILEGSIEIYQDKEDFRQEYAVLFADEFFGEIALLDDLPRTASARARTTSTLLGFYRPDLESLLARNPSLAGSILMNIARLIGRRLVNTNQELEKAQIRLSRQESRRSVLERARKPLPKTAGKKDSK